MLRKSLLSTLLAAGLLAAPAALAKAPDECATFVWKVTAPNQPAEKPRVDYLLGTMHMPLQDGEHLPAQVEQFLDASDTFVMEADLESVTPDMVAKYIKLKGDKTLKQLLPAPAWRKLVALGKPRGLTEPVLQGLEPWFLTLTLSMPKPADKTIMDTMLHDGAAERGLSFGYLESAEEQFEVLDAVSQAEDLAQLREVIDQPDAAAQEMEKLIARYRAGDLEGVQAMVFDAKRLRQYPEFHRRLFDDRNAKWMPELMRRIDGSNAFIAVGLGHLLGERGVVAMLKAKGYDVEPVAL